MSKFQAQQCQSNACFRQDTAMNTAKSFPRSKMTEMENEKRTKGNGRIVHDKLTPTNENKSSFRQNTESRNDVGDQADTHGTRNKTQTIQVTKNKQTVQARREIGGCRPKQFRNDNSIPSQVPISKTDKRYKTDREMTGTDFLKSLLEKDCAAISVELTQSLLSLKVFITRTSKDEDFLLLFLQVIAKAFMSRTTPTEMINLFEALKENLFFDTLEKYLVDLIIKITTGNIEQRIIQPVLRNTLSIGVGQIMRNPSSIFIFRKLQALLGQIIDELLETDAVDDDIMIEYQHLTEERKRKEKEQKELIIKTEYPKPTDDFRQYSVSPTKDEITSTERPQIRPNKVDEPYEDLHDYLDVHFRLLREDFVRPLREGMVQYIKMMTSNKGKRISANTLKNLDLKVYENVRVRSPVVTQHGLCYKLQINMTPYLRKVEWKFSKRLIYGSLVCLTDMQFNEFLLATVVEREDSDIKHGFFTVHFESQDFSTEDVLNNVYRMAETSGYFESYKHVLASLQLFNEGDLPFQKYIVDCNKETVPPAYLRSGTMYDLQPLVHQEMEIKARPDRANKNVRVLDPNSWPSKELLHMDKSQYDAVQNALTNEFAIIQGPPGTGKTYIGLQIVKALLHNKAELAGSTLGNGPMLVVCYTNHALDQFLEGILKFFKGKILRVGGRSNSEELTNHNLKHYRQMDEPKRSKLAQLKYDKRSARRMMELLSRTVQRLAKTVQVFQTEIVREDAMIEEIGAVYDDLTNRHCAKKMADGNHTCIVEWLEIEKIKNECLKQVQREMQIKRTKHIKVENDAARLQADRMIDDLEKLQCTMSGSPLLASIRKKVAYYVPEVKSVRYHKTKEFQQKYLKLLKSTILEKLSDQDIMSQQEANRITSIWGLLRNERWRLYRLWIQKSCAHLYEEMEMKREGFENASKAFVAALEEVDKEIMRNASVLGMTTSGAARYQSVLRDLGPKIIIVEEAAEVLEAHIITTLSKKCEHLVLIGDHKQLRPNPTVYELAVRYNLDVSLFERMVKNGMQLSCLELQHRMRPEISGIMRHIYPDLKDHDHVKTYPNVKGISSNFFLVNHSNLESSDKDIKSYSNENEAKYAVALCKYLLLQGYEKDEITVLTTYTGQLKCMKDLMPKEEFDGVKVTVVDNYQGEENEIIILSLVRSNTIGKIGFLKIENRICVALSRARVGFFIIGNFDHLSKHSDLWEKIVEDMRKTKLFGEGLSLYCQNHPDDNAILAKNHEDFKKAPEGGCRKKCDVRLSCGHKCERFCHVVDQKHETDKSRCVKACVKTCENNHKCPAKCFETCPPCIVPVNKTMPKCGHMQTVPCKTKPEDFCCQLPCETKLDCGHLCKNACGMEHTARCSVEMEHKWPCGHTASVRCWEMDVKLCPHPCRNRLKCGHICTGTCGTCIMGRVHQPCRKQIMSTLQCGHKGEASCQNDPICNKLCNNVCDHFKCEKRCWEPCDPCKMPCAWRCEHYSCKRRCDDVCDRPRCNKPCRKILQCKHKCIGFCGEICPKICRKCDKKKLATLAYGDIFKPNARFVLLQDCGHLVESFTIDKYMLNVEWNNIPKNKYFPVCPLCQTPIRKCRRYGGIIKKIRNDIRRGEKREYIWHTDMYNAIKIKVLRLTYEDGDDTNIYTDIEKRKIGKKEALADYPCHYFKSICKTEFARRLNDLHRRYTHRQLNTIEIQFSIAMQIVDLRQKLEDCNKENAKSISSAEKYYMTLLHGLIQNITQPRDTITEQEIDDFECEIQTGNILTEFMKIKPEERVTDGAKATNEHVLKIQSLLFGNQKLTDIEQRKIERSFKRIGKFGNNNGTNMGTEGEPVLEEEKSTEQGWTISNECSCLQKLVADDNEDIRTENKCSALGLTFGSVDVDSMGERGTRNMQSHICDSIGFFDSKDENEFEKGQTLPLDGAAGSTLCGKGTCVCCIEDIKFGYFDDISSNEISSVLM